ncbi:MAG: DUF1501 domain-containing protein [Bryobacteraceae bacterium]
MQAFFARPHYTRRHFFQIAGGITASFLAARPGPAQVTTAASVTTQNKAKNVIFVLLAGAPSHTDTFDLKEVPGVTPAELQPTTIGGIRWPNGILPRLGQQIPQMAIVRSMRAWALVHSLAQTWTQIGRNPAAALGNHAPNIGSIVAIEKEKERRPSQVFPTFLALNSNGAAGGGYLPSGYAPFKLNASPRGIPNTTNPDGPARFEDRWSLLHKLDDPLRIGSPLGRPPEDYQNFYQAARGMMYNPVVDAAFRFAPEESARYGSTGFGNACLVAKQVLAAGQGTRFIQITLGGWDMHNDIYTRLFPLSRTLDDGLATLLEDLQSTGLLSETLVVAVGEFGRTVGKLSAANGRDHYLQQSCVFAGAGIKGGRAIGATDETGGASIEYGWARERDIRVEDVEATIYSALGINWTTVRYDDPFGRGFEYVPFSSQDLYGPVNEIWNS